MDGNKDWMFDLGVVVFFVMYSFMYNGSGFRGLYLMSLYFFKLIEGWGGLRLFIYLIDLFFWIFYLVE